MIKNIFLHNNYYIFYHNIILKSSFIYSINNFNTNSYYLSFIWNINYSYWFSYILFLVFLGGLLVLFIYVSSVASNEMFNMNYFMKNTMFLLFLMSLILSLQYMYNLNWLNFSINYEMKNLTNFFIFFNNENKINLTKLYNKQTYFLMMMLIIYLFITLVAIVKITNIFFGPLRSTNY
uniref:NADH-ubiquinone oxidoreductase chain 6 n=1 Tax=Papilio helenus TaxID=76195 RepID=A0A0C5AQN1_9NEOP|nr:NADH dehydrogenase subunit 6 [Papilio helenus]